MATPLQDLVAYCDTRTRRNAYKDAPGAFNGLQVANSGKVTHIGAAVDAGVESFSAAEKLGVDFLIVHHGMYWDMPKPVTGPTYSRLSTLFRADCALYSCHLPLDGHPEIGNNALLPVQLGTKPARPFMLVEGEPIGWIAPWESERSALKARLEALYPRVTAIEFGQKSPREIAFCSGSGNSAIRELKAAGVDTLVTGELRQEWYVQAQELGLNLYLCGHYATEVHGVRALGQELAKHFELPFSWIETQNPL